MKILLENQQKLHYLQNIYSGRKRNLDTFKTKEKNYG